MTTVSDIRAPDNSASVIDSTWCQSDLVAKYKEKIDSDSRQIRQLDIERNEAELAKSKYQVSRFDVQSSPRRI